MKTIEFKQQETKAAFLLLNALQEKVAEQEAINERSQEFINEKRFKTPEHKAQSEMFLISNWMEVQLMKDNIELLQKDIENQTFNF